MLWVIVPVKPLKRGKSRLSGVLSETERAELNRRLLINTIETLKGIPEIDQILVVSRDPATLSLARDHGARTVLENGSQQLNKALARATAVAHRYAARAVLILPADLPLLTKTGIQTVVAMAKDPPVVVITPDRHGRGTNALLVYPTGLIDYEFGPGSFEKHCDRAERAGARVEVCDLPSLALDVDMPEDLIFLETNKEADSSE